MKLPAEGRITQRFHTPTNYIAGRNKHEAVDIVTEGALDIHAPFSGTISKVINLYTESKTTGYGNEVWLRSDETDVADRFAHVEQHSMPAIGKEIKKGDVIGKIGRTGYRVPRHVYHTHWERYLDGNRVDPLREETLPPEPKTINKRRMKLTDKRYLVYVRDQINKVVNYWVIVKHKNHPLETRHKVLRRHTALTRLLFAGTEVKEVGQKFVDGLTKRKHWKPNRLARKKPGLYDIREDN